jgi:hypothetical protein
LLISAAPAMRRRHGRFDSIAGMDAGIAGGRQKQRRRLIANRQEHGFPFCHESLGTRAHGIVDSAALDHAADSVRARLRRQE